MKINKLLFVIILLINSILLVSAQSFDFREGSENVINFFIEAYEPFLDALFGRGISSGDILFEKFLIFLILLGMVYVSLSNVDIFRDNTAVHWIISITVPLLAVRFMDFSWINTILLEYQVLGVALAGILPFIIYLYFIHGVSDSSVVRKIGWIFFILVYFGLWATTELQSYGQIYFWTMVVALLFLFFDGTIHRFYLMNILKESGKLNKWEYIRDLKKDIQDTKDAFKNGHLSDSIAKRIIKKKERQIKWFLKH